MSAWLYLLLGYLVLRRDDDVETSLDSTPLAWPVRKDGVRAGSITQEYRPPSHMGVDIAIAGHYADAVATVVAVADGKVVRAELGKRGHEVLIDHGDWASGYLHLADLEVKPGDAVRRGQALGAMGADPTDPQGVVHLHLQLAPGGHTADPAHYLTRAV